VARKDIDSQTKEQHQRSADMTICLCVDFRDYAMLLFVFKCTC